MASGTIKAFMELDADKLSLIGAGIRDLGIGMLAFAGGTIGGTAGGIMERVSGWFGTDSPLEKIKNFADSVNISDAKKLTIIGKGIRDLGEGMAAFAGVKPAAVAKSVDAMATLTGTDLTKVADTLMKSSEEVEAGDREKGKGKYVMKGKTRTWVPDLQPDAEMHQGGPIKAG